MSQPLIRLAAAVIAAATTGCTLIDDWGHDEAPRPVVGLKVSKVDEVRHLGFWNGRLLAASSNHSRDIGLAVVDTSADTVIAHYAFRDAYGIRAFAIAGDRAIVSAVGMGIGVVNLISGENTLLRGHAGFPIPDLFLTSGRVFIPQNAQDPSGYLHEVQGAEFSAPIASFSTLAGFALQGGRMYASQGVSAKLLHGVEGAGTFDTLDVGAEVGDSTVRVSDIQPHGTRLFLRVLRPALIQGPTTSRPDSNYLAVFEASTLTLVKTIALPSRFYNTGAPALPRVDERFWYMVGRPRFSTIETAVEVIDLDSAIHRGSILTGSQVGGDILDFVKTGPGRGYAVVQPIGGGPRVRRVSWPSLSDN